MCHTAVCAIVKNEAHFLKEWIYYHYMIGFEKFIIYNNESDDDLYAVLRDFVAKNIVDICDISGSHIQETAYTRCLETYKNVIDWIAFIDIDEFIVMKNCPDIRLFLSEYAAFPGLSMHWDMFGSNGHISRPEGLVIENYTGRLPADPARFHVKSIVRPEYVTCVKNPHIFAFTEGKYAVDENGFPITNPQMPYTAQKICVNHYFYKSQQDYEEKIRKRTDNPRYPQRRIGEFYDQTRVKQVRDVFPPECLALLRACVRRNIPLRRLDIPDRMLRQCEFHDVSGIISSYIQAGKIAEAKTAASIVRKRFEKLYDYMQLCILVHIEDKNQTRAEAAAVELIRAYPLLQSYYMLYMVYHYFDQREEAERLRVFMKHVAPAYKNEDPAVREKIAAL